MNDTGAPDLSNRILDALPKIEYQRLLLRLEICDLNFGDILFQPDELINDVYFPTSGFVSVISITAGTAKIGIGMVGDEGVVGLPLYLGKSRPANVAIVHGAGKALKIGSVDFLSICEFGGILPNLLKRFTNQSITHLSQILICSRFHSIELRLVWWLLMAQDKLRRDQLSITQTALSGILGVRREAVTKAIGNLQLQHVIEYNRGKLAIVNRKGLETIACPCYTLIRAAEKDYLN